MQTVTLYSGPYCPYCTMAKQLLNQIGVTEIVEIKEKDDPEAFRAMREATGTLSVPQIFIGETHIGGFDDTYALHKKGELLPLLNLGE